MGGYVEQASDVSSNRGASKLIKSPNLSISENQKEETYPIVKRKRIPSNHYNVQNNSPL